MFHHTLFLRKPFVMFLQIDVLIRKRTLKADHTQYAIKTLRKAIKKRAWLQQTYL